MRIVIDLQGAQAENRQRGIGRYSLALTKGIIRNCGKHEVIIALNGALPDTIEPLRATFQNQLPQTAIRVWRPVIPARHMDPENDSRRSASEKLYETFLKSLQPDIVLITSMFEGLGQDAVTSISQFSGFPVAAVLYDLIPLINEKPYLENPVVRRWYNEKISFVKNADHLLSISESSRHEALQYLHFPEEKVTNISTDADPQFIAQDYSSEEIAGLRQNYNIEKDLVLYTGGIDYRKNIDSLIIAFSRLPLDLRRKHQLAIVCSVSKPEKFRLQDFAASLGLKPNELVLTGFVPENDLIALYNLCKVFVFPSWHEGFGLPVLEAMRCGAAVIGSNTSSLPEVIGTEEAIFNPRDVKEITNKLAEVLSDDRMRERLKRHAVDQAACFSWDKTARKAIEALESLNAAKVSCNEHKKIQEKRLKLAYFSPLPPERSGISDYSAELLPELSKYYDVTVVVEQTEITESWILNNCKVMPHDQFLKRALAFDRVIYHFGNSQFHAYMLPIIEQVPGVIVLHDFFLSGLVAYNGGYANDPLYYLHTLYESHGYEAINRYFSKDDTAWVYPCNRHPISCAKGVITHSDFSIGLAEQWVGKSEAKGWKNIPLLRKPGESSSEKKQEARKKLGISDDAFVVCSFGMVGKPKLNDRLLEAWCESSLAHKENCSLYFVGQNEPGEYGRFINQVIDGKGLGEQIKITGWTDSDTYIQYLQAADVGVQLRGMTRGETSAAVLDCMNYGLATIVNANGSMNDLPDECVLKIPDAFRRSDLVLALESLCKNKNLKEKFAKNARIQVLKYHEPRKCGEKYAEAIEYFYAESGVTDFDFSSKLSHEESFNIPNSDLKLIASAFDYSIPMPAEQPQLLVDISELVQRDSKSGIQRVVKNILHEWLKVAPSGYRVEPIYASPGRLGYFYARSFTLDFLGCPSSILNDAPVSYRNGDVFLGLDLNHHIPLEQETIMQDMSDTGVYISYVVYDLLPIQFPEFWESGHIVKKMHEKWLEIITSYDSVICISRTVAREVDDWIEFNHRNRERPLSIEWFHLGADVIDSTTSKGCPDNDAALRNKLAAKPSFLMVGTLEPRKGHSEILDAFDILWRDGQDINLVIVGKKGWKTDELATRIKTHKEYNKRLHWLEGISDEFLDRVFESCACLIAGSYGEGFGLPLIEAAQRGIPIIARNIPVFREVAGEYAYYFDQNSSTEFLAGVFISWLNLYERDLHSNSKGMPFISWKECAFSLISKI